MACFLVPAALGIITLLLRKTFPKRMRIEWLNMMLWGAVIMLAVEHIAHGEIVPFPPFLTTGLIEVLPEMLAVGGPMAIFSTMAWAGMVTVTEFLMHKTSREKIQIRGGLGHV